MKHATLRHRRAPRRARGQSLVEFLIVTPIFLFLVLVIFQLVLIYRAKMTLDYAALEAARMGAVKGADKGAMQRGLIRGLMPLYATSGGAGGAAAAWGRAKADIGLGRAAKIEIISPTKRAWDNHKERQHNRRYALPNDSLAFRDRRVGSSGMNVQDANILKIKVTYHYPLIVPFVDRVMRGDSDYVKPQGFLDPAKVKMSNRLGFWSHYRIPIESYAIVRMQTPIYDKNLLP
ncbi:TadE family protein [Marilutibacter maris]|uniref:Pilus assembly protein n=1 Tax=Marilutibacter maris TaxID=1605891 RepID=A0A2U9T3R1_9GAMM|nr:TadE family protein [Lysobacter maris]AWV05827.1 TadE family protein [Lysobacter maris]KAB8162445.1 pilus assembly protein [Lysobacter maris]